MRTLRALWLWRREAALRDRRVREASKKFGGNSGLTTNLFSKFKNLQAHLLLLFRSGERRKSKRGRGPVGHPG